LERPPKGRGNRKKIEWKGRPGISKLKEPSSKKRGKKAQTNEEASKKPSKRGPTRHYTGFLGGFPGEKSKKTPTEGQAAHKQDDANGEKDAPSP